MRLAGIFSLLVLMLPCLRADSLMVTPGSLSRMGIPGAELTFVGTLLDTDSLNTCDSQGVDCLFLNSIGASFNGVASSFLTLDDSIFYNSVPGILSDDGTPAYDSYMGPVFGIVIDPLAPAGIYTGTIYIYGAHDDQGNTTSQLASVAVSVQVVPEPAPFFLALTGLAAIAWRTVVKRRGASS